MQAEALVCLAVIALVVLRLGAEQWLSWLNRSHVRRHAGEVPEAFRSFIDEPTYRKSIDYTLAKSRFGQVEEVYSAAILLIALFSGVLPWLFTQFSGKLGVSAWSMAGFLFSIGVLLSLPGLPVEWMAQFRLEARFGFNTTTQGTWWLDRVKSLLLAGVLGYPLLVLILKIVEWTGAWWWLWAWGAVMGFQVVMLVLAPILILPLFNKFTPLPEGSLRERLLQLASRTGFKARSIEVMDGSKRSRHSNAFFTGLGKFRRIVLFDTLIQQLTEPELEAVLAHEIGHYRLKHIPRMLIVSALTSLLGFFAAGWIAKQAWFYRAFGFGFEPGNIAPALLLFALLAGLATFWFSPLLHAWSRKHEYEADAFARSAVNGPEALVGALRKLNEKNLSNLTPHPIYSSFYYSHPALLERERALLKGAAGG